MQLPQVLSEFLVAYKSCWYSLQVTSPQVAENSPCLEHHSVDTAMQGLDHQLYVVLLKLVHEVFQWSIGITVENSVHQKIP